MKLQRCHKNFLSALEAQKKWGINYRYNIGICSNDNVYLDTDIVLGIQPQYYFHLRVG